MTPIVVTVVISVVSTLLAAGVAWFFMWIVRKGLADLKRQVTPNGGSSLYDHSKKAMELAGRAVDISLATDAKVKQLETKLDAFFLSRIP